MLCDVVLSIFSAPVQTGPRAHPASCTMGTGSLPGVKRPGRGADPQPHLQCRVFKKGRAIPLPTLRAMLAYKGRTFTFTVHRFLCNVLFLLYFNETQKLLYRFTKLIAVGRTVFLC